MQAGIAAVSVQRWKCGFEPRSGTSFRRLFLYGLAGFAPWIVAARDTSAFPRLFASAPILAAPMLLPTPFPRSVCIRIALIRPLLLLFAISSALTFFDLFTLSAQAADSPSPLAPDSIAGRVLQDLVVDAVGNRYDAEKTFLFGLNDGRFTTLVRGSGTAFSGPATRPYSLFLERPRPDGTYIYTRLTSSTARIMLTYGDHTTETLDLTFTTENGGTDKTDAVSSNISASTFSLSDPAVTSRAPAINVSLRGVVDPAHPLIAGFVVPGTKSPPGTSGVALREVLIRVVGPSLAAFGVAGTWADPDFKLYTGTTEAFVYELHYGDWTMSATGFMPPQPDVAAQGAFEKLFTIAGAFPLLAGSKDAVQFVRLDPGDYTVVASALAGDPGGTALIEIYFLP